MPSTAASKPSMSPGELTTCEDFFDSHLEYAIDLLFSIEKLQRWHGTDSCSTFRAGGTCALCEVCSADGLMGATQKAFAAYKDVETHLKGARASLGRNAPHRGAPSRQTLFKSNLAKTIFLCIATVGDNLRSEHETWQTRLRSEVTSCPSSALKVSTGSGGWNENTNGDMLLPTYSGPRFVNPKTDTELTTASTGLVPDTTPSTSSRFVIVRRCLSSDCPCEANTTNATSNTNLGGTCRSQATSKIPPLPLDSEKTHASKAARSTKTNTRRRATKTGTTSDAQTQAGTDVQTQKRECQGLDTHALDTHITQEKTYASETARSAQAIGSSSPSAECDPLPLVADPRIFRLRTQILRSDDACRALMKWCRAWMVDLQLDHLENHGTGPTHELIEKDTPGCPPASTLGLETLKPRKPVCTTGDDETTTQGVQFDEQEQLKARWLTSRQNRFKSRKRRLALTEHKCISALGR